MHIFYPIIKSKIHQYVTLKFGQDIRHLATKVMLLEARAEHTCYAPFKLQEVHPAVRKFYLVAEPPPTLPELFTLLADSH